MYEYLINPELGVVPIFYPTKRELSVLPERSINHANFTIVHTGVSSGIAVPPQFLYLTINPPARLLALWCVKLSCRPALTKSHTKKSVLAPGRALVLGCWWVERWATDLAEVLGWAEAGAWAEAGEEEAGEVRMFSQ